MIDCRSVSIGKACDLRADVESTVWDPFQPYHLYASLENGQVLCLDIRNMERLQDHTKRFNPYLQFQAHDKTVSALNFSASVKGMLATASIDQTVKIWDVSDLQSMQVEEGVGNFPKCIAYKSLNVGKLFTLKFSHDDPFTLAAAGDEGKVAIWESDEMEIIRNHFQDSLYEIKNPYLQLQTEKGSLARPAVEADRDSYSFQQTPDREHIQLLIPNNFQAEQLKDDSWMDDNDGIATNSQADKKKKKKKMAK
jgi:WD40 repeat protein